MPVKKNELVESNLLRALSGHTLDLIYAKDTVGRFTFANMALARMVGITSPEELLGKTDFDFNPPEVAQKYYEDDLKVIHSGQSLVDHEEFLVDFTAGESRWHSTTKVAIRDKAGKVVGLVGITRDITTAKQAEAENRQLNAELEQRVAERTTELHDLSEALAAERTLMRALIDTVPDIIYVKDKQSNFLLANDAVARIVGKKRQELIGKNDFDFFPKQVAQRFFDEETAIIDSGEPMLSQEEPVVDQKTGETRWLLTSKMPLRNSAGAIVGLIGAGRDITERRQIETALSESEERFRSLTELSSDWYWEQDQDLRFVSMTDGNAKSSYQNHEITGKALQELPNTAILSGSWPEYETLLAKQKPFRDLELRHDRPQKQASYISLSGLPVFTSDGQFRGYRGIGRDITERKISEERIHYYATHDSLTALPNRFMFTELLNAALASARRHERKLAVLFIDLDRFKNINDTLGHEAGDKLLSKMAKRLKKTLRSSDVIGRLGGDEFVILVPELEDSRQAAAIARKVLSAAVKPVIVLGQECRVTASVGICIFPDGADSEQELMKNADIAMYRAKEEGKNTFQFYSEKIKARSLERLILENNLRSALERNEFFLHYQAKRDLQTGEIVGVEALVRWRHPDLGVVSPAQFIPLAEETGLIVLIGRWVLKTACAQNMAWQKEGLPPICMAVNLSMRQSFDDGLIEDVATVLKETGMPPELLELEITEGMVMQDTERAISILTEIKKLGVRLAIDDFGVGYSSLSQIKKFPIDTLKVDGSFIRDIPQNMEDRAITEAIIAMGKTLSLTVIAEGVETEEQETFLREHACDQSQGYFFSRPIPPEKFSDLMRQNLANSQAHPAFQITKTN